MVDNTGAFILGDSMEVHPIRLNGSWDEGYALDLHTQSSDFIGENVYGYPHFNTKYTALGKLVKMLKYKNKYNALEDIMQLISPFLDKWELKSKVDVVLPVPPSELNRPYQPVFEIAKEIACYLGVHYNCKILVKTSRNQAKEMDREHKDLDGCIVQLRNASRPCRVLLVDDLFQTGSTLDECTRVLRRDRCIQKVYVLTMTKTRRK